MFNDAERLVLLRENTPSSVTLGLNNFCGLNLHPGQIYIKDDLLQSETTAETLQEIVWFKSIIILWIDCAKIILNDILLLL